MWTSTTSQGYFTGKLDTDLITKCPMVDAPGGAMPLRDWLKHLVGVDSGRPWFSGSTTEPPPIEIAEYELLTQHRGDRPAYQGPPQPLPPLRQTPAIFEMLLPEFEKSLKETVRS